LNQQLTIETFQQNLRTKFRVSRQAADPVTLDLVNVQAGQSTSSQQQFSVLLSGPAADGLGQGTFRMEHEQMGVVDLFIVPVERHGEQIRYQAVFNCITIKTAS